MLLVSERTHYVIDQLLRVSAHSCAHLLVKEVLNIFG
jgi:hypothetical protein